MLSGSKTNGTVLKITKFNETNEMNFKKCLKTVDNWWSASTRLFSRQDLEGNGKREPG